MNKLVSKLKKTFLLDIYHYALCFRNYSLGAIFNIFPLQDKVVVDNFGGRGYGDSGKFIIEELLKDNKLKIVWLVNSRYFDTSKLPKEVKKVKYNSIKSLYEMATAKFWIDNVRKSLYPPKRKHQYYIQTWHGGISLKKAEKDIEKDLPKWYVKFAKKDSKMADLFISNNKELTSQYRRSWWYDGEILESGLPRCDIYFDKEACHKIKAEVKEKLSIKNDTKILMYAPTFRNDYSLENYNIDFERLLSTLEKNNEKWVILLRLHPDIANLSNLLSFKSEKIIDVSSYDDSSELLIASDIVISDYSSIIFDYAYLKRPIFLYASDLKTFQKERGYYFDYMSLPFPISTNNNELIKNIEEFNNDLYQKKVKIFFTNFGVCDRGDASKKVVNWIYKKLNGSDLNE